jgi:dTDP-4-amino-4,6-dideoxygalactose transaminase
MADQNQLELLCAEYGITLIEDAAAAVGASLDGRMAGSFGRFGVFSFNGNKILTTGGGGAVLAPSHLDRSLVRRLSSQARTSRIRFEHDRIGFNYRVSNLAASIGVAQLRSLPQRIDGRTFVRYLYESALGDVATFQCNLPNSISNQWLTTAVFPPDAARNVVRQLRQVGIESRPGFTPLHKLESFRGNRIIGPRAADRLAAGMVSLPSSGRLTEAEVGEICQITRQAVLSSGIPDEATVASASVQAVS